MAFQKVGSGPFKYVKYAECQPGDILATGYYLGTRQGTYGINHQIRADDGTTVVLNSSGQLNYLLENNAPAGTYIQVSYAGTEILSKGKFKGKPVHKFELGIDSEKAKVSVPAEGYDEGEEAEIAAELNAYKYSAGKAETAYAPPPEDEEEPAPVPPPRAAVATAQPTQEPRKITQEDLMAKYRKKA